MSHLESLTKQIPLIEQCLGYTFKDKHLLALAFVHRSFFNEHRDAVKEHNERIEFLGDSVLGLIVSDYLYHQLPHHPEGQLSLLRSKIVEAPACMLYVLKLGVASHMLLGKGERMNEGRGRETILADLFEALVGAVYVDGGMEEARRFFLGNFSNDIEQMIAQPARNWKAELQDFSQKKFQKPPFYKVIKEEGPDHGKEFHIVVLIDEEEMGEGKGPSKKLAEQAAAEDALRKIHG